MHHVQPSEGSDTSATATKSFDASCFLQAVKLAKQFEVLKLGRRLKEAEALEQQQQAARDAGEAGSEDEAEGWCRAALRAVGQAGGR